MVSTSARNAGGPWFDSRSRHDRFLYANSVCLYILHKQTELAYIYINLCIYLVCCASVFSPHQKYCEYKQ